MLRWLDLLFPPRVDEITLRDINIDGFLALVAPKLVVETRPETVVLLPFNDSRVRSAIHEAKYRGSERAFKFLSLALVEYLRDFDDENYGSRKPVIIVPVPLGKIRIKERGFNQIEEVAKRAGKELEIKVDSEILERIHETVSQVSLPREKREENMRGAFRVTQGATQRINPSCTYIVVDDVITTGATLQSAVDAFKKAGVQHIIPLALAH